LVIGGVDGLQEGHEHLHRRTSVGGEGEATEQLFEHIYHVMHAVVRQHA
jgi:hypothetical protein